MVTVSDLTSVPFDEELEREWLVTNGLGGYASSTVPGLNTRKYHGLLVAAMSPPRKQMVLLSRVEEFVNAGRQSFPLASCEYPGGISPQGHQSLRAFDSEPFPRWAYQADGWTIEKHLRLISGENTTVLCYTLLGGDKPVDLLLNPLFALRGIHELNDQWNGRLTVETVSDDGSTHLRIPATHRTPEIFLAHDGRFQSSPNWYHNTIYRAEQRRGYAGVEDLWMPGTIRWTMAPGQTVYFACSTDPIELPRLNALCRQLPKRTLSITGHSADGTLDTLLAAADQFAVTTDRGAQLFTGLPWAPRAGRDSLISFCGLLLVTGRLADAKSLLQNFAASERDGLMPSEIPSDGSDPKYAGADVSLWFINAVWQYLRYGGDVSFAHSALLPVVDSILRHYQAGTGLGIHRSEDGLIVSREPGAPVTWMDAKVGDWVITPRHGAAVEVNALWYNAQRIGAVLMRATGRADRATELAAGADDTKSGFSRIFWNESLRCCFDVVDGETFDASVRPNQLLAVSLPFPVLTTDRHHLVLDMIRRELLTPVGLRTLSADDPSYAGRYFGAITTRDRAYHQGSVFPWLLGPYVATLVRTRGRSLLVREEARALLQACLDYFTTNGLGQLCELFDGDAPHHPGGLPASARSVAEVLRAYAEDVLDLAPRSFELHLPQSREAAGIRAS